MNTFEIVEVDEVESLAKYLDGLDCKAESRLIRKMSAQLAALKEENERLKAEKNSIGAKLVGSRLAVGQLKARVAELEAREVDAIANKICGHLPKGYYIKLCLEKEAGWVELDSPDVATDRDDFEGGIYSQLLCALEVAEELSKEPANEGDPK